MAVVIKCQEQRVYSPVIICLETRQDYEEFLGAMISVKEETMLDVDDIIEGLKAAVLGS